MFFNFSEKSCAIGLYLSPANLAPISSKKPDVLVILGVLRFFLFDSLLLLNF
jgi:hypothetical protein